MTNKILNQLPYQTKSTKKEQVAMTCSLSMIDVIGYLPRMMPAVPVMSATVIAPSASTSAFVKLNFSGFLPRM